MASLVLPGLLRAADVPVHTTIHATTAARSCVIFVGADLAVEADGRFWPIDGVEGSALVSQAGEIPTRIPLDRKAFSFTFEPVLKVSAQSAQILDWKNEPTYSVARDPGRRWLASQALAATSTMDSARTANILAAREAAASDQRAAVMNDTTAPAGTQQGTLAEIDGRAAQDTAPDVSTPDLQVGDADDPEFKRSRAQQVANADEETDVATRTGDYDALEVSFRIVTAQPLVAPYAIAVVEYYRPDPNDPRRYRRVLAENLPKNVLKQTAGEQVVRLRRSGFPIGYRLSTVSLHLYDQGREVATNLSERRTPVTRTEAIQFIVVDHVARHRDANAPVELIEAFVEPSAQARLQARAGSTRAGGGGTAYVRVSRDGVPEGVFRDSLCAQPWPDPAATRDLLTLRFKPEVVAGKAVSAVAVLRLCAPAD